MTGANQTDPAEDQHLRLRTLIRRRVARKLQASLRPDDGRADNQDALELCSQIELSLWSSLRDAERAGEPVRQPENFANSLISHAVAEFFRERRGHRTRLANAVRYVLRRDGLFALWQDAQGNWIFGAGTALEASPPAVATLLHPARPPQPLEQMKPADWRSYLSSWLEAAGGPQDLDDAVNLMTPLFGLDDDGRGLKPPAPTPERRYATVELLALSWKLVVSYPREQRVAYLLNLSGGEIDVFPECEIADWRAIEQTLSVSPEEYTRLWRRRSVAPLEGTPFALLRDWIPLADDDIAAMLMLNRQQVIGLRRLVRDKLANTLQTYVASE